MTKSTVLPFEKPAEISPDPLTEVLQTGARELLSAAVQAEVSSFLAEHAGLLDEKGLRRVVRHGFLPERDVMTGIGKVSVRVRRVRDRGAGTARDKIRFRSSLVPPYLRKAKSVEDLRGKHPIVARFLDECEVDALASHSFPETHRKKLRTTNMLERQNSEVKRRSKVVGIFPNEGSFLRLIGAVMIETNADWQVGYRYIDREAFDLIDQEETEAAMSDVESAAA